VHNARKLLDEIRLRGYDGGYSQLKRRPRGPAPPPEGSPGPLELMPGPGVGRGFLAPEVEQRSLAVYEEGADVAAI